MEKRARGGEKRCDGIVTGNFTFFGLSDIQDMVSKRKIKRDPYKIRELLQGQKPGTGKCAPAGRNASRRAGAGAGRGAGAPGKDPGRTLGSTGSFPRQTAGASCKERRRVLYWKRQSEPHLSASWRRQWHWAAAGSGRGGHTPEHRADIPRRVRRRRGGKNPAGDVRTGGDPKALTLSGLQA